MVEVVAWVVRSGSWKERMDEVCMQAFALRHDMR